MLTRIVSKRVHLLLKNTAKMSSGHGHDHDHHDYSVQIDREKPWIKYNSSPRLISIEGVEDTNYPLQPPLEDNPFEHLENKPFFSFERQVYNEPWFHEDSHEPYNSLPERGYMDGQDPLETRFIYSTTNYIFMIVGVVLCSLWGMVDSGMQNSEATLYNQIISRRYVTDTLQEKNNQLNALKAREAELLKATAQ